MNYTVKKGDTLYTIARELGVSTLDIINANKLSSYFLTPGTSLVIPESTNIAFFDYIVQRGDSLYSIAQKYNVDPVILAEINGLKLYDYIYPNQIVIVPKTGTRLYITKEGDSIGSLVQKGILNLSNLSSFNKNIYLVPEQLIISTDNEI